MQLKLYLFFGQFIFVYDQHNFVKALIGSKVRKALKNEFPFVVPLIQINQEDPRPTVNYVCVGSLISKRDVLTAESCILSDTLKGLYILVGSTNLNQGLKYSIYWWITHDQWSMIAKMPLEFLSNDIAVIRLLDDVPRIIKPGLLTFSPNIEHYGLRVEAVGWGSANDTFADKELKTVFLKAILCQDCETRIEKFNLQKPYDIHRQTICTSSSPYALLSKADIGGPILYYNVIIAINNRPCPYEQDQHTDLINSHVGVYYYKPFILDIMHF